MQQSVLTGCSNPTSSLLHQSRPAARSVKMMLVFFLLSCVLRLGLGAFAMAAAAARKAKSVRAAFDDF